MGAGDKGVGRRGRLRLADTATLAAVLLVVLLVSLPRLRHFALRENESDARWLVGQLAALVENAPAASADLEQLIASRPAFARQLDDAEFLGEGRVLRRHGYLFEVCEGPDPGVAGGPAGSLPLRVRAWPWKWGQTGRRAYAWIETHGLAGHANEDGRWSGPQPPVAGELADRGWRTVER